MEKQYDVVIVGAGPAGAGAASALKESGLETLIVEKNKMPRYKMCSGILFPSSVKVIRDHFGEVPDHICCEPKIIKGNRAFLSIGSPFLDLPFAAFDPGGDLDECGYNTRRADLDSWLCSQTGAEIMDETSFSGYTENNGTYSVKLTCKKKEFEVKAGFLVGADGTLSRVRKCAFPEFHKNVGLVPNYEEHYVGEIDLEPGYLYLFMDRKLTGYFATVFHKDEQIVVVTGVRNNENVKEYFTTFKKYLEDDHGLKVSTTAKTRGIVLTDMSARKNYCLGRENVLLAGEAGGFLRGGEGITSSLISGLVAGDAINKSIKSNQHAIKHFQKLAKPEIERCEKVHETMEAAAGFNVFLRE